MYRRWRFVLLLALVVASLGSLSASALACPNCKVIFTEDQQAQSANQQQVRNNRADGAAMGRGYNYSIYLMMATPFLLFAGASYTLWRHTRHYQPPQLPS